MSHVRCHELSGVCSGFFFRFLIVWERRCLCVCVYLYVCLCVGGGSELMRLVPLCIQNVRCHVFFPPSVFEVYGRGIVCVRVYLGMCVCVYLCLCMS